MVTLKLDKPVFEKLKAYAKREGYGDPSAALTEIVLDRTREQDTRNSDTFTIPGYLLKAFKKHASERGEQLIKYLDELAGTLILSDLSPFENC